MVGRKWKEAIFPNDSGSDFYKVTSHGHVMTIRPWWADCGAMGETIECSCGFQSSCQFNHGCWQQGHDEKYEHKFDKGHGVLYDYAMTL